MRLLHTPGAVEAVFDDQRLISYAGLEPVMRLAEQCGLRQRVRQKVRLPGPVGANPGGKVATIVAGMLTDADSIDDLDRVRHGGMGLLFDDVYAPSTLGSFLRAFTHGHVRQLESACRQVLVELAARTPLLPAAGVLTFIDIDSLLRPCYGKAKQGASFGHAKVGGYQILRRGYSPLIATISTPQAAPVVAATRLRAGRAGSSRGAVSLAVEAIGTAKAIGAVGQILLRADSAFYAAKLVSACRRHEVRFSITVPVTAAIRSAIAAIADDAWTDISYRNAVWDEDEQRWISDAQIAETGYTAFAGTKNEVTGRLIVRRVKRLNPKAAQGQDQLFTLWRYHAVFTDSRFVLVQAEQLHRGHAIQEQTLGELIDGPLAHLPSGDFAANAAWLSLAGLAHNLTRAAGTLAQRRACPRPTSHHPRSADLHRRPDRPPRPKDHPSPTGRLALATRLAAAVHRRPHHTRLTSGQHTPTHHQAPTATPTTRYRHPTRSQPQATPDIGASTHHHKISPRDPAPLPISGHQSSWWIEAEWVTHAFRRRNPPSGSSRSDVAGSEHVPAQFRPEAARPSAGARRARPAHDWAPGGVGGLP